MKENIIRGTTGSPTGYYSFGEPGPAENSGSGSPLSMTVVYNNIAGDPALQESWGFGIWIEGEEGAVLFDTGSDGNVLLKNIAAGGIDLTRLHSIVISHEHWDHISGLPEIISKLKRQIAVFVPKGLEQQILKIAPGADIIPVTGPQCITGEIWITGPLDGDHKGKPVSEQSLLISRHGKSYLITGCSHPGIQNIVSFAKQHFPGNEVSLITGGFHMNEMDADEIRDVIGRLAESGVRMVAPSHCTGDTAMKLFRETWRDNFLHLGLGESFEVV